MPKKKFPSLTYYEDIIANKYMTYFVSIVYKYQNISV